MEYFRASLAYEVFHGLCEKLALAPGVLGADANLNYGEEAHMFVVVALVLGIVSGLRTMTSPAVTSWAARMGRLAVSGTPLTFMGFRYTPIIFTVLAIGELINDKLPQTASRKAPPQFIARIVSGCLVGATVGAGAGSWTAGLLAGAVGAVIGTLGGAGARGHMAKAFGTDLPAALLEDVAAIVISIVAVSKF
jgi:uncharacterized membrane protein